MSDYTSDTLEEERLNQMPERRRKAAQKYLDISNASKKIFGGSIIIGLGCIGSIFHVVMLFSDGILLGATIPYAVVIVITLFFAARMMTYYGNKKYILFIGATAISFSSIFTMIFIILSIVAGTVGSIMGDDTAYSSLIGAGGGLLGLIFEMRNWSKIHLKGFVRIKRRYETLGTNRVTHTELLRK